VVCGVAEIDHEPVHLSAVDVGDRRRVIVARALVVGVLVVVGPVAVAELGIGDADRDLAVLRRKAVGPREGPEVVVEGAVLLDRDDDVIDGADPGRRLRGDPLRGPGRRRGGRRARGRDDRRHAEDCDGQPRNGGAGEHGSRV
jgi:hypothetical protein